MTVKEYTEELYRVSIRAGKFQDTPEKTARYVNGLKFEIQDDIGLLSPKTVEEVYQMALKAEEKLLRKKSAKGRGTFVEREVRVVEESLPHPGMELTIAHLRMHLQRVM